MILEHVAHGTRGVVIVAATLHAHGFGHGDLHLGDVPRVPQRLEQGIAEAQRQQVLHTLLAEVMVDPEDALLVEDPTDAIVDLDGTGQIMADGLFQQGAGAWARQAGSAQRGADLCIEARRGRQVIDHITVAHRFDGLDQGAKGGLVVEPRSLVMDAIQQRRQLPGVTFRRAVAALDGLDHRLPERIRRQLAAPGAEHLEVGPQIAVALQSVERGQQHALGKITGGAKDHHQTG